MPAEMLKEHATKAGFDDGCDIDIIYDYVKDKDSILELGAGYGRVLKNLINRGYKGKLTAIERSMTYYKYLKTNFSQRVNIIRIDVKDYQPQERYDAILWMWSHISEFPKDEQISILKHVMQWLEPNGVFIFDTFSHTIKPKPATKAQKQSYFIESEYGNAYGYIPSPAEMKSYADQLGFTLKHIEYQTKTLRPRNIYIMSR